MYGKKIALFITIGFLLMACAGDSNPKRSMGAVLGTIGGAVVGSQMGKGSGRMVSTAIGALAGSVIGADIGKTLDRVDQMSMKQAEQEAHAAPIGSKIVWNNPDTGNSGSVTPLREGNNSKTGNYCREYNTTLIINGRHQRAYGTACRQPDGSWKVAN
jgi:surface antigen